MTQDAYSFFGCGRWAKKPTELEATVGGDVTQGSVVFHVLNSRKRREAIRVYVSLKLGTEEEEERQPGLIDGQPYGTIHRRRRAG